MLCHHWLHHAPESSSVKSDRPSGIVPIPAGATRLTRDCAHKDRFAVNVFFDPITASLGTTLGLRCAPAHAHCCIGRAFASRGLLARVASRNGRTSNSRSAAQHLHRCSLTVAAAGAHLDASRALILSHPSRIAEHTDDALGFRKSSRHGRAENVSRLKCVRAETLRELSPKVWSG